MIFGRRKWTTILAGYVFNPNVLEILDSYISDGRNSLSVMELETDFFSHKCYKNTWPQQSQCQCCSLYNGWDGKGAWTECLRISEISAGPSTNERDDRWSARRACTLEWKTPIYQKSHVNYSELLQLAKGWGNLISGRIIIWRLLKKYSNGLQ